MKSFRYQGKNRKGQSVQGTIRAESSGQAREQLKGLGYSATLESPARLAGEQIRPVLWTLFALGCVWCLWDLSRSRRAPQQEQVVRLQLHVRATSESSLGGDEMLEFSFPEIPLVIRRKARECLIAGELQLDTELATSRPPSYCLVRHRSTRWEQKAPVSVVRQEP